MKSSRFVKRASAVALPLIVAGCTTWHEMDRSEKGTAVGAAGGALAGAAIGGPVGAVIGAGAGGYAGHYEAQRGGLAANIGRADPGMAADTTADLYADGRKVAAYSDSAASYPSTIRAVQQALNERGFGAGQVDGVLGPNTEHALRQFQQANSLARTGVLDQRTLSALDISH